ncbi:Carboxypeptidase G2 precursor [Poriferisphaera corsica]|uniref:Carboxypeptidase G2 n=1 Tax=Poriferisphaera corsica TaxID=2528020 RepID=A0A517YYZ7_9BACT|nr:hydrolase [Poriferisphaera corsica]QDU35448.1 Carboxypeptidase G2 precursor [Poriferisphaera corsica]
MNALESNTAQWIDSQQQSMVQQLCALAEINSHTYNIPGINAVAELVTQFAAPLELEASTLAPKPIPNIDSDGNFTQTPVAPILKFTKRPNAPIQALLMIHLDTVYPADHPFQSLTWIDDNTLNGPGVLDAKGGIITMLTALQAFEQSPHAQNLGYTILFNTDEEVGSLGSVDHIHQHAKQADFALVYEPSLPNGHLVSTRKGSGNFSVVIHGQAAHAGRDFFAGQNALSQAAKLATQLETLINPQNETTLNIGYIHGGGPVNVVPDKAVLKFNARIHELETQNQLTAQIDHLIEQINQTPGFSATLHGSFYNPPKQQTTALAQMMHDIQTLAKQLNIDVQYQSSGGVCDGNKIAAVGTPVIDTLGPTGNHMHNTKEFVLINTLPQRAKLSAAILAAYASQQLPCPQ